MAKTYLVTLAIELDDEIPDPIAWNWHEALVEENPGVLSVDCLDSEQCHLAEAGGDPATATVH